MRLRVVPSIAYLTTRHAGSERWLQAALAKHANRTLSGTTAVGLSCRLCPDAALMFCKPCQPAKSFAGRAVSAQFHFQVDSEGKETGNESQLQTGTVLWSYFATGIGLGQRQEAG